MILLQVFIFTVTFAILMVTAQRSQTLRVIDEKERLSLVDSLTQIGNRRHFSTVLDRELKICRRSNRPVSLILMDIDHFKEINDSFGHPEGDRVLQELAALLVSNLRTSDFPARWGGEEFAVILPDTSLPEALQTAEKLRVLIQSHPFPVPCPLTSSFGVIECGVNESEEGAVSRVDAKLYEAKERGRNRVVS